MRLDIEARMLTRLAGARHRTAFDTELATSADVTRTEARRAIHGMTRRGIVIERSRHITIHQVGLPDLLSVTLIDSTAGAAATDNEVHWQAFLRGVHSATRCC